MVRLLRSYGESSAASSRNSIVGTSWLCVTRSRSTVAKYRSASKFRTSPNTSRPPAISTGPNTWFTEPAELCGYDTRYRDSPSTPYSFSTAIALSMVCWWVKNTPLGTPVVPLV